MFEVSDSRTGSSFTPYSLSLSLSILGSLVALGASSSVSASTRPDTNLRPRWYSSFTTPSTPAAALAREGARSARLEDINGALADLHRKFPAQTELSEVGRSRDGRAIYGLTVIGPRTHRKGTTPDAPTILITGGIHGDEYLGFEHELPAWFLGAAGRTAEAREFFAAGGKVLFIPVQNPDGFVHSTRTNAAGKDLNRNFGEDGSRAEPEVRAVRDWVEGKIAAEKRTLSLTIDYHCCTGALLYPTHVRGRGIASVTSANATPNPAFSNPLARIGTVLGDLLRKTLGADFRLGNSAEILGYQADGTAKDYFSERYRSLSLTFEGVGSEIRPSLLGSAAATTGLGAQIALWNGLLGKLNDGRL